MNATTKARPPRASHFLSFPITSATCQRRAQEVIDRLIKAQPRPDGVDDSLATDTRSMHLTLGIMPLSNRKDRKEGSSAPESHPVQTVSEAAELLRDCLSDLRELLAASQTKSIPIYLSRLSSFQSDSRKCRVLYAEPKNGSPGEETLHELAVTSQAYLRERFHNVGMLSDYKQPLTLHCTLMKASARKGRLPPKARERSKGNLEQSGKADSQQDEKEAGPSVKTDNGSDGEDNSHAILAAAGEPIVGEEAIGEGSSMTGKTPQAKSAKTRNRPKQRVPKNLPFDASLVLDADPPYALGESFVDRVQLCQMGRKAANGAYEALEEILLFD